MRRYSVLFGQCVLACAGLWLGPLSSAQADTPATPCAAGVSERAAAQQELDALDAAVEALGIAADPKPLLARIAALTETRCLRMMGGLDLEPTSGLALKTYWKEGGAEYVRSYLQLGMPGDQLLWVPPSVRRALTLETDPTSPIRELLCPFADASCGAETRGWAIRAAHEFDALAKVDEGGSEECRARALKAAPKARFAEFRACQVAEQREHASLPIGATRAPQHGWLIVQGRRGHYSFCDEARAYDLATGSAYRVASCSGLALQAGGNVNFRATDAGRQASIEIGHLPLDALREAAWMLLLLDSVDRHVVESFGVHLPKEVPLSVDAGFSGRGFGLSGHWTSADTTQSWRVEREAPSATSMKQGTLTWSPRMLDDAPAEHAVTLLRVAEAGMTLDCPEVPPPAAMFRSVAPLSASGLDADPASLSDAANALRAGWQAARARQLACTSKARAATAVKR